MPAAMPRAVAVALVTEAQAQSSGPALPAARAAASCWMPPAALLMYGLRTSVFVPALIPPTFAWLYVTVMAPVAAAIVTEVTYLLAGGAAFNAAAVAPSSATVVAPVPMAVFASEASEKPSVIRARTV